MATTPCGIVMNSRTKKVFFREQRKTVPTLWTMRKSNTQALRDPCDAMECLTSTSPCAKLVVNICPGGAATPMCLLVRYQGTYYAAYHYAWVRTYCDYFLLTGHVNYYPRIARNTLSNGFSFYISATNILTCPSGSDVPVRLGNDVPELKYSLDPADGSINSIALSGTDIVLGGKRSPWNKSVWKYDSSQTLLWDYDTGAAVDKVAVYADGTVICISGGYVISLTSAGALNWAYYTGSEKLTDLVLHSASRIAVCGAVGGSGYHLWYIDKDAGTLVWGKTLDGTATCMASDSTNLYVGCNLAHPALKSVYAFDTAGTELWSLAATLPYVYSMVAIPGVGLAVVGNSDGIGYPFLILNTSTGAVTFQHGINEILKYVVYASESSMIYAAGVGGGCLAFRLVPPAMTVEFAWRNTDYDGQIDGLWVGSSGSVLICEYTGGTTLKSLFSSDGTLQWEYNTGGLINDIVMFDNATMLIAGEKWLVVDPFICLEYIGVEIAIWPILLPYPEYRDLPEYSSLAHYSMWQEGISYKKYEMFGGPAFGSGDIVAAGIHGYGTDFKYMCKKDHVSDASNAPYYYAETEYWRRIIG